MTSPSALWRLSEGDDENDGEKREKDEDEDDDTDRAVDESLSTDDDLLEVKRDVSFTLAGEENSVVEETTGGRKRRDTVRKADDKEA